MKHYRGFKILMLKAYFDKGLSLTNYAKYFIALFGIASRNVSQTLWITAFYAVFCFFLGIIWYKLKLTDTENEINNIFNPFVKEVRHKLKKRNI